MGAVYFGVDDVLQRPVALKRVLRGDSEDDDVARAEREARIAASLNHHNVVAVFDFVDDGDERWLVMEYVDGQTLSALVKETGAMEPDRAAHLVAQAAHALATAHEAGIVHRDVKPSNMMVDDSDGLKILDFGIAKVTSDPSLTQTGIVTGSPAYLAPEVATGSSATEKSDVWSIGATLHHLLTGQPPYEGETLAALYKIVNEEPPRAENAGWLAPLLASTMIHDPEARWTMRQVADFLSAGPDAAEAPVPVDETRSMTAVGAAVPVTAPLPVDEPGVVPSSASGEPRRRSALPVLIALGAVVIVAILAMLLWQGLAGDDNPTASETSEAPATSSQPKPAGSSSSEPSPEPSSPTSAATQSEDERAEAMEDFVEDYLSTVTSDPGAAYSRLTPKFQQESGGYDGFAGWWTTVERADVSDIEANPGARTVAYVVDYSMKDGSSDSDAVTLVLVERDGGWLIDGEP